MKSSSECESVLANVHSVLFCFVSQSLRYRESENRRSRHAYTRDERTQGVAGEEECIRSFIVSVCFLCHVHATLEALRFSIVLFRDHVVSLVFFVPLRIVHLGYLAQLPLAGSCLLAHGDVYRPSWPVFGAKFPELTEELSQSADVDQRRTGSDLRGKNG